MDGNGRLSETEIREFCQQLGECAFHHIVVISQCKVMVWAAGLLPGRALDAETISDTLHEMDIVSSDDCGTSFGTSFSILLDCLHVLTTASSEQNVTGS